MHCDRCDKPFEDGDEVEVSYAATFGNGQVWKEDDTSTHHTECPWDDED